MRSLWALLTDEQGKFSTARVALWVVLFVSMRVVWADTFGDGELSALTASLLTTLLVSLIAWAGGNRMASYLLPQLGSVVSSIASAVGHSRKPRDTPDPD